MVEAIKSQGNSTLVPRNSDNRPHDVCNSQTMFWLSKSVMSVMLRHKTTQNKLVGLEIALV